MTRTSRPVGRLQLLVRLESLRARFPSGAAGLHARYGEPMSGTYPLIPTVPLRMRRATLVPCSGSAVQTVPARPCPPGRTPSRWRAGRPRPRRRRACSSGPARRSPPARRPRRCPRRRGRSARRTSPGRDRPDGHRPSSAGRPRPDPWRCSPPRGRAAGRRRAGRSVWRDPGRRPRRPRPPWPCRTRRPRCSGCRGQDPRTGETRLAVVQQAGHEEPLGQRAEVGVVQDDRVLLNWTDRCLEFSRGEFVGQAPRFFDTVAALGVGVPPAGR